MKRYSESEIDFLKCAYPIMGGKYCSEKLNRSIDSVRSTVSNLGVKSLRKKPIVDFKYNFNLIINQEVNHELFINTDCITKEVAYLIGFIWADGYCVRNEIRVEIVESDANNIKDIFKASGYWYENKRIRKNRQPQLLFYTTNNYLYDFFIKMGKYPYSVESHEKILDHIPDNLKVYFLRGLIDGDGCFYYNKKHKSNGHQFSISGRYEQKWDYLCDFLKKIGVNCKIDLRENNSKSSVIRCTKVSEIKTLIKYLYELDDSIYLKRKKEKAFKILNS